MQTSKNMIRNIRFAQLLIAFSLIIGCSPEDGENGADGLDGTAGLNSLIVFSEEGAGPNCQYGGIKIELGQDANANLLLESEEIESTKYVCGGIEDPIIRDTRIVLHNNNGGASGTFGTYINRYPAIIKFDKRSWSNLSSIVYTASIRTDNPNNSAIVDLYNATFGYSIPNSTLSTNSVEYVNVISDNLIESLPDQEFNLYLRLRSENITDDTVWISNKSELIIRQEN